MADHHYAVIDVNGEHEITRAYTNNEYVSFFLDTVDILFPFSIICTDNNNLSFFKVEKL